MHHATALLLSRLLPLLRRFGVALLAPLDDRGAHEQLIQPRPLCGIERQQLPNDGLHFGRPRRVRWQLQRVPAARTDLREERVGRVGYKRERAERHGVEDDAQPPQVARLVVFDG